MKDVQVLYCDMWLPGEFIMDCLSEVNSYDKIILRDLLREELKTPSSLRDEINNYLKEGKLVPACTVEQLILKAITNKECFLLSGYPRTIAQFTSFLKFCDAYQIKINKLWYFKTVDFGDVLNNTIHFQKLKWSSNEIDEYKRKLLSQYEIFRNLVTDLQTYHKELWTTIELNKNELQDPEKILLRIKNSA